MSYVHPASWKVGLDLSNLHGQTVKHMVIPKRKKITTPKTNKQTNKTVKERGVGEWILGNNEQMFSTKGDKMDVGKETKSIFFLSVSY